MGGTALIHSVEYVTYDHYVLFWGAGLSCLNLKVEDLQIHDCSNNKQNQRLIQIPTRVPEKIVVAIFSGILVNSGIQVEAGRHIIIKCSVNPRLNSYCFVLKQQKVT